MNPPVFPLAPVPPTESLRVELQHDAHESVVELEHFFTHFLGHIGMAILIFVVISVLGYVIAVRLFGAGLQGCGVHEHARRQAQFIVAILVAYVAASAALGSLGLEFWHVAAVLSVVTLVVTYGLGRFIANLFAGFTMQNSASYELGRVISISYGGVVRTGPITQLTWTHVQIESLQRVPGALPTARQRTWIPNSLFSEVVVDVLFMPPPSQPPRKPPIAPIVPTVAAPDAIGRVAQAAAPEMTAAQRAAMARALQSAASAAPSAASAAPSATSGPAKSYDDMTFEVFVQEINDAALRAK